MATPEQLVDALDDAYRSAINRHFVDAMGGDPDFQDDAIDAARAALLAEFAALKAALEPFAVAAASLEKFRDDRPLWAALDTAFASRATILLTVGQLRRARAAFAPKGIDNGGENGVG